LFHKRFTDNRRQLFPYSPLDKLFHNCILSTDSFKNGYLKHETEKYFEIIFFIHILSKQLRKEPRQNVLLMLWKLAIEVLVKLPVLRKLKRVLLLLLKKEPRYIRNESCMNWNIFNPFIEKQCEKRRVEDA
jgi:hypothetical protein